jgi:hypothetical protein
MSGEQIWVRGRRCAWAVAGGRLKEMGRFGFCSAGN